MVMLSVSLYHLRHPEAEVDPQVQYSCGQAPVMVSVEVGDEADTERAAGRLPGRNQHPGHHQVPEARGHGGHHDPGGEEDHSPAQQPQSGALHGLMWSPSHGVQTLLTKNQVNNLYENRQSPDDQTENGTVSAIEGAVSVVKCAPS